MEQLIQCPGCGTRLKVKAGGAATFQCPKCQQLLRAPAAVIPSSPVSAPNTDPAPFELADDLVPAPSTRAQSQFVAHPPAARASAAAKVRQPAPPASLQPFLNRWLIAMGAVCGLAVVLGLIGLFSDVAAVFSAVVCMLAAIGCLLGGRFWIAIMLGRESVAEGVVAAFVPLTAIVWAMVRKGNLLKGLVVYLSAFAPCLLGLLLIAGLGVGSSRSAAREKRTSQNLAKVRNTIHEMEQTLPADGEVRTAQYRLFGIQHDIVNFENGGDAALREFKLYVPGSLKIDAVEKEVEFQHRGNQNLSTFYKLYLGFRFKVGLGSR